MKKPKGKSRNKDGEKTSNYQRTALKSSKAKVKESKRNTGTDNNINLDDASFKASSQDSEKWYSSVPADPDKFDPCPNNTINELMDEARKVLDSETNGYNIKASKNSEQSWMRSVMSKGTGKDKMAAFTLMIQEKALYNLHALQSLVSLVKPGKKESVACIDTLVELFITELLPPETKLKKFSQRPLSMLEDLSSGNPAGRRRRLVAWYFEDQLKTVYQNFIDSLRVIASEAVEASKEKAVKAMAALLEAHPEQETILLSNIVNKMGDPSKKVASKSMHCLTQVLGKHPNMKGVIINEVEKLLFRPNVGQKARYYSICFLSQILFRKNDSQIAANLIKLYFSFFKACVKLGDVDSRMLSVLLSGVNRAYPYAREAMDTISEQLDTLYKVIHVAPFHVSLQGLSLLFQVADYKNNVSDRFYSVLYRKLLDPELCHTSHVPIFLNLTFQALKKDESVPRVRAFIKRLLQVCCVMPVSMICGTLYMISQIIHNRSGLVATSFGPPIKTEFDSVKVEKQDSLPSGFTDDESEDEHYEDVPLDEDILSRKVEESRMSDNSDLRSKIEQPAWIHKIKGRKETKHDNFDPMQRNPLYANGALCTYSELCLLSQHFHPTVALFASQILNSEQITYSGDPLKDFTLLRFLERFSFKNPKKQPETQSNSLFAKRQNYRATGVKGMPVTSKMYLSQEQGKVPVDEKYLFCFLQKRRNIATEQKLKDKEDESDVESVNSDEFEELLDDIMKKKGFKKDIDEDDDFDADIDFANEYKKNMSFKKSLKKKDGKDKDSDSSQDEAENSDNEFDDDVDAYSEVSDKDYMNDDLQEEAPSEDLVDPQDDHGDLSEEDFDFENLDDGAEDMDFDDSDDTVDENMSQTSKKFKKKKKAGLDSDVFASAEEFSELIEAAGAAREGSSGAVSNKDKASMKQLNWEADRDRWVKGYKSYTSGGKGAGGKTKGKPRGVKRPSFKTKRKKRF